MENPRNCDCVTLFKGDTYPVEPDAELLANGWQGGQGVMWVSDPAEGFHVARSDGFYCGFLLKGSSEPIDHATSMDHNQQVYQFATMGAGGWVISTSAYEKYTWASRTLGGPLVPLVYEESDRLVFSNRGLWTKEDEWTLANDSRKPNDYYIGFVVQAPTPENQQYLTIQVSI